MNNTGYQVGSSAVSSGSQSDEDVFSISRLQQQYRDFSTQKEDEIAEQRQARHYYHNDQLTSDELKTLAQRHQPPVIRNKIDRKINAVVGLIERLRQDPKAYPRTPQHAEGADIATAAIRYVNDVNEWDNESSEAARNGAINGIFGIELGLEGGDRGDPDVSIELVDPDTFFYDPRSYRYDFEDARYMGVAKWIDLDVAKELFPGKDDELDGLISRSGGLETTQQLDRERRWVDSARKRLFIVEHWGIQKGEWYFCFYVDNVKLASGGSPFIDEKGKTFCRYIMASVNVDHDGDRYGFVRNLKSLQDEVNARASKGLHLLNTRRIIMERGAHTDVNELRREAARPDGVVIRNKDHELEFDDAARMADLGGQLEFLAEVKTEIENFGPNPALIGEGIENKSGRAIALLQQAGIAELGPFIKSYRGWKIRVYRAIWNTIQRHWTAERWIRVTDDEGLAQFIQLNGVKLDDYGVPRLTNALGHLDVDIILDEGPDTMNIMQDTQETLRAMAQSGSQIPPEIFIEVSDLPSDMKKRLLEKLEQMSQPDPMAVEAAKAELENTQAKTAKDMASAQKTMAEVPNADAQAVKARASAFKDVAAAAMDIANGGQPQPTQQEGL